MLNYKLSDFAKTQVSVNLDDLKYSDLCSNFSFTFKKKHLKKIKIMEGGF